MSSAARPPLRPLFNAGDPVIVINGPRRHRSKRGVVTEIIGPSVGDVFRYRVRFPDGTTATFFAFELVIA